MSDLNWLSKYCSDSVPRARKPFQLVNHLVATDGRVLCAIPHQWDGLSLPAEGDRLMQLILEWVRIATTSPALQSTTLGDLWAWLDHCELRRCPECWGAGNVWITRDDGYIVAPNTRNAIEVHCDCGGKLIYSQDDFSASEEVLICGLRHKREALAQRLDPRLESEGTRVELGVAECRGIATGFFRSEKFLFASTALRLDPESKPCRVYTPGAGVWYMQRRDAPPELHPGTDWFREQGYDEDDFVAMWGTHVEGGK